MTSEQVAWYGGKVNLHQPKVGFRATTDALLLAAAIPDDVQHLLELGAGVGAATLALAARLEAVKIKAVEREAEIAEMLRLNVRENRCEDRITVIEEDAFIPEPEWAGRHDVVMMNPPYNDGASTLSADDYRQAAMAADDFMPWIKAAARALAHKGRVVIISRADRLDEILSALASSFGDVAIKAVHTSEDEPAKRVLVSARKGVKNPMVILPPLVINPNHDPVTHEGGVIAMVTEGRDRGKVKLPE